MDLSVVALNADDRAVRTIWVALPRSFPQIAPWAEGLARLVVARRATRRPLVVSDCRGVIDDFRASSAVSAHPSRVRARLSRQLRPHRKRFNGLKWRMANHEDHVGESADDKRFRIGNAHADAEEKEAA